MAPRKRWEDLSDRERVALIVISSIEFALTVAAAVDLYHRPQGQVRGRKALWWAAIFIQPVGPVAYLLRGRR